MFNPFVANVSILYPLKTLENQPCQITIWHGQFSVIFREYKMGALARNGSKSSRD